MVESSKILTVSYGTFSCTLEGFDDSFSTMKAIAEYFRDLAAGDRYFGAEPPTPDAEMLTRIAEREISRRVEAVSDASGITLKAGDALGVAAPAAAPATDDTQMPPVALRPETAPDMETTQANAAAVTPQVDAEQTKFTDTSVSDVATEDEMDIDGDQGVTFADMSQPLDRGTPTDSDSVAAKLMRIRAVVGTGADDDGYIEDLSHQAQIEDAFDEDEVDHADAETEAAAQAEAEAAAQAEAEAAAQAEAEAAAQAEAEAAAQAEAEAAAQAEAEAAAQVEAEAAAQAEAEAAAQAEAEAAAQAEAEAAAQAEAEAAEQVEAEAAAQAEAEAAAQAEAEAAAQAEAEAAAQAEAEAAAQAEAEAAAQAEAEAAAQAEAKADVAEDANDVEEPSVPKPTIRARILRLARPTFGADTADEPKINGTPQPVATSNENDMIANIAATAALKQKETETPTEADSETAEDDAPFQLSAEDTIAEGEAQEDDTPSVADRIAALNLGGLDQDTDDTSASDEAPLELSSDDAVADEDVQDADDAETVASDDTTSFEPTGSLSAEEEADLQQELAEVEADEEQTAEDAPSGRRILPDNDDAALTRIMGQADEQLSEPEGNRRRNAIAQLKAAVAATEAARQLGDNADDKRTQENAFREDFKEVVRPTPASAVPRTEVRRERPRPTPLKLVASQRVDNFDEGKTAASAPVLPRRVATTTAAQTTDAGNFAEFAEEMGATELPDLLEAAAAYIAYVEGVEDFSRPQIIQKVQATTEQPFSREDGLRSFGTLLRQGRISKVRNGRFQVSDQTRFKPDQKAG